MITRFLIPSHLEARLIRCAEGDMVLYEDHLTKIEHLAWQVEQLKHELAEAVETIRKHERKNKS